MSGSFQNLMVSRTSLTKMAPLPLKHSLPIPLAWPLNVCSPTPARLLPPTTTSPGSILSTRHIKFGVLILFHTNQEGQNVRLIFERPMPPHPSGQYNQSKTVKIICRQTFSLILSGQGLSLGTPGAGQHLSLPFSSIMVSKAAFIKALPSLTLTR